MQADTTVNIFINQIFIDVLLPQLVCDWDILTTLFKINKIWHNAINVFLINVGRIRAGNVKTGDDNYYKLLALSYFCEMTDDIHLVRGTELMKTTLITHYLNQFTILPNGILHGVSTCYVGGYVFNRFYFLAGKLVKTKIYIVNKKYNDNIRMLHNYSKANISALTTVFKPLRSNIKKLLDNDYYEFIFYPYREYRVTRDGVTDLLNVRQNEYEISTLLIKLLAVPVME